MGGSELSRFPGRRLGLRTRSLPRSWMGESGDPGRRHIGLHRNHAALDFRAKRALRRDYGDCILD